MNRIKCVLLAAVLLLATSAAFAGDITVKVTGIRGAKGGVIVHLWNAADGFPMGVDKAVAEQKTAIQGDTATVVFKDVKPGTYAVRAIHDENGNGKLDTNFMGKPKEGWGASNNPHPKMRPPHFDEAQFTVTDANTTQTIALIY